MQKDIANIIIGKDEEIFGLRNHNQILLDQINNLKGYKKLLLKILLQLISKESRVNKETMTELDAKEE